ncbi:TPA: type I glutamate--ammonia ligase [Candidatus Poribacteria bacterium]|nr:type I glutamate--ammonia ligase [Candidatus Poribacteria bacterium]HIM09307.1 type I glutamate--ammonia ligase [Candidatus Poribacteria bacterium]HIO48282.1 type I glutamate--ammonia ligase [Candidatus Poribacteria bacterium]
MSMTPSDVITLAKEKDVKFIDLKFTDFPGMWQHFSMPVQELTEDLFEDGAGFDGSSIRGFQAINESDMLLMPDPSTAIIDPACKIPTLSLICNIEDPITRENYTRDVRYIAQKAENYLVSTGIGDVSYWGPEAEFFLFSDVKYGESTNTSFYSVDSIEATWNSGKDEGPNLGYKLRPKEGYFPVPPSDHFQDLRSEMVLKLLDAGVDIEVHHHEVATAGQAEIDLRFDTMTRVCDKLAIYKYVIKNTAREHGLTATFMPKPLFQDNGSGMHVHQSIWKDGKNMMYSPDTLLSDTARHYVGGLLKHARALCAIIAPTTNSYKRLVPGFEAPVNLVYSARNRSAIVRIPTYSQSEKARRVEFRAPDPACNGYLAMSAMLMAGLDGVQNQIDPGDPTDVDLYELSADELANIGSTPGSLGEALDELEKDHEFLLKGDVFTQDVIDTWIDYKRENEVEAINMRPHPYEFFLYYDI